MDSNNSDYVIFDQLSEKRTSVKILYAELTLYKSGYSNGVCKTFGIGKG